jgi:OOP family OmpA-OmpF porin
MKSSGKALLLGWLLTVVSLAVQAVAKDHPLIKPYPGSRGGITAEREFDEYELITGPIKDGKLTKSLHLEGKITELHYSIPEGRSVLEVYRNYEAALKQAGFQTLFACKGHECGTGARVAVKGLGTILVWGERPRVLSAKLSRPEGDVYAALHIPSGRSEVVINIVEVKPMETGMVAVNAAALARDIGKSGHVAVYEILFDTGKADLKPESEPALQEIAKLLKENAALKLHVVGHTDNVGALAMNLDLSKRRAAAVMQALTSRHGIAATRLNAEGVGPLAPVASNDSEEGRAKNRRVELVKQ